MGLFAGRLDAEIQHLLLETQISLVQRELSDKLVRLSSDVEGDLSPQRQLSNLVSAHARNNATILRHSLRTHKHHIDLSQETQRMRNRRLRDLRDGDSLTSELLDDSIALLIARLIPHIHHSEFTRTISRRSALEQSRNRSRRTMSQDALSFSHKSPTGLGDTIARSDGTSRKEAPIAEQVFANGVEAPILLLKRGHEVLEEQVGAGGEWDGVGDGSFEAVAVQLDGVEGFVDGGGGDGVEEDDEGFDGGDGLGELGVGGEELSVGCDDAEGMLDGG